MKKLFSIVLCLIVVFSLAGCGPKFNINDILESEIQEILSTEAHEDNSSLNNSGNSSDDGWEEDLNLDSEWDEQENVDVPESIDDEPETIENLTASYFYFDIESNYENATAKGVLHAYSSDDNIIWSYETDDCYMTELETVQNIGETSYGYLILAGGEIICVAKNGTMAGSKLWTYDLVGASALFDFDEEENLYICGYYGPALCVISPSGECLQRYDDAYGDCYWPNSLTVNADRSVDITYDSTDGVYTYYPFE